MLLAGIFSFLMPNDDAAQKVNYASYMMIVFTLIYLAGFAISHGPVLWIYLSEILPRRGLTLAVATNWIFVIIVVGLVPTMINGIGDNSKVGAGWTFIIFAILLTIVIILFYNNF
jgi:MFS transporter, SP family, xylose:H+ symportor